MKNNQHISQTTPLPFLYTQAKASTHTYLSTFSFYFLTSLQQQAIYTPKLLCFAEAARTWAPAEALAQAEKHPLVRQFPADRRRGGLGFRLCSRWTVSPLEQSPEYRGKSSASKHPHITKETGFGAFRPQGGDLKGLTSPFYLSSNLPP